MRFDSRLMTDEGNNRPSRQVAGAAAAHGRTAKDIALRGIEVGEGHGDRGSGTGSNANDAVRRFVVQIDNAVEKIVSRRARVGGRGGAKARVRRASMSNYQADRQIQPGEEISQNTAVARKGHTIPCGVGVGQSTGAV